MTHGQPARWALVLLAIDLSYLVISPFLAALTWAVIFAVLFHGAQAHLSRRMPRAGAALLITLGVALAIVGPTMLALWALVREAPQIASYAQEASAAAPRQIQRIWDAVRTWGPSSLPADPTIVADAAINRVYDYMSARAGAVAANLFATLGSIVAMLFALFFMVRDGDAISLELRERLPFSRAENDRLIDEARDLVVASVGAGLAVAAAQGVAGGVVFWLLGMGAPLFWAGAITFCSLLPVVGATIVWAPAGVWLLLSGETTRGVMLLLAGAFGISMIDNILRPVLLSGRAAVSGLVIFFGLLGGAAAFGPVGIVTGPIVLVLAARLIDAIHRSNAADRAIV